MGIQNEMAFCCLVLFKSWRHGRELWFDPKVNCCGLMGFGSSVFFLPFLKFIPVLSARVPPLTYSHCTVSGIYIYKYTFLYHFYVHMLVVTF